MLAKHVARSLLRSQLAFATRSSSTWIETSPPVNPEPVRIVEVGPRDGLQNESAVIPPHVKVELVNRLTHAGMDIIEAGSFVSPKWVPQMAGTADVLKQMDRQKGFHYPVLVPNMKGLENLLELLAQQPKDEVPYTNEIAIFTAATDAFCKANTNCTIEESLARLKPVAYRAAKEGLRVRGYVSVVIDCPYSGKVDPFKVREVTRALLEMGCYEVSLGDTVGTGNQTTVSNMLETVIGGASDVSPSLLAGHYHDTFGMGVSNILTSLLFGIRTFDSSVGGLGGCPYSPGATGNVATEDVLYAFQGSRYFASGDLAKVAEVGSWISKQLNRPNASRVGKALEARRARDKREKELNGESVAAKL